MYLVALSCSLSIKNRLEQRFCLKSDAVRRNHLYQNRLIFYFERKTEFARIDILKSDKLLAVHIKKRDAANSRSPEFHICVAGFAKNDHVSQVVVVCRIFQKRICISDPETLVKSPGGRRKRISRLLQVVHEAKLQVFKVNALTVENSLDLHQIDLKSARQIRPVTQWNDVGVAEIPVSALNRKLFGPYQRIKIDRDRIVEQQSVVSVLECIGGLRHVSDERLFVIPLLIFELEPKSVFLYRSAPEKLIVISGNAHRIL